MKKAQDDLMFVFSLILISLVLTLAFITFSIAGKGSVEERVNSLESNEININLLNYLRTIDDETNLSMSELITYSYHKNNFDDVKKITQDSFNKVYTENNCPVWILNTHLNENKLFEVSSDFNINELRGGGPRGSILKLFGVEPLHYSSSSTYIPTLDKDKIKVSIILGCLE